jgi:hypothetical protein
MTDLPPESVLHQQFLPSQEPRPRRSGPWPKVLAAVGVLAVAGLAAYFLSGGATGKVTAGPGDCVRVVSAADAEIDRVDCAAHDAVYQVAKRLDNSSAPCPAGEYSELISGGSKLCLMLNAEEGDCFTTTFAGRNRTHERVPCVPPAEYRVVKVVAGKDDTTLCASGEVVASYSEPPMTICLTPKP